MKATQPKRPIQGWLIWLESYKHLREHGNTAFIFLLELALCPIFFIVEASNRACGFLLCSHCGIDLDYSSFTRPIYWGSIWSGDTFVRSLMNAERSIMGSESGP